MALLSSAARHASRAWRAGAVHVHLPARGMASFSLSDFATLDPKDMSAAKPHTVRNLGACCNGVALAGNTCP